MIWLWISALDESFENPEQVIRRHAEHRRAQAAERIERDDVLVAAHLVGEPVDQVDLGRDGPRCCRAGSPGPC